MSNKTNSATATEAATAPKAMTVTPEPISAIATVANVTEAEAEKQALERARQAAIEADANRQAKAEKWKRQLEESPEMTILGQTFKTIQLEKALSVIDSDAGKIAKLVHLKGLGTERITGQGKIVLVPDEKAFQAVGKTGALGSLAETKIRLDNATALRNILAGLVHLGLIERKEDA